MKCVQENEEAWVFSCLGCGQVNIITRPEYRQRLRNEVRRDRASIDWLNNRGRQFF